MNKPLKKSLMFGAILFQMFQGVNAQEQASKLKFHFGTDAMFMNPVEFENTGNDFMRSKPSVSPNFYLGWALPVKSNFEIGVNANFVFPSMNLGLEIDGNMDHQVYQPNGEKYNFSFDDINFRIGDNNPTIVPELYFKYRLPLLENSTLNISAGAMLWFDKPEGHSNLLGTGGYGIRFQNGSDYDIFRFNEIGREEGPSIAPSYFVELGYEHKKVPGLLLKARYNYSNHVFRSGSYEFYNFDEPTFGTYTQTYSYFSLGLEYTLQGDRRRAKKAYLKTIPENSLLNNRQLERELKEGTYLVNAGIGASFLHDVLTGGEDH
ncbi:hypothetical protein, partial [Lishizhenia sp.]|uniref:hypothetical protein n=1 Tax=Lishizhenia sp. TaxID=2497594 RepID=UPI00299EE3CC